MWISLYGDDAVFDCSADFWDLSSIDLFGLIDCLIYLLFHKLALELLFLLCSEYSADYLRMSHF